MRFGRAIRRQVPHLRRSPARGPPARCATRPSMRRPATPARCRLRAIFPARHRVAPPPSRASFRRRRAAPSGPRCGASVRSPAPTARLRDCGGRPVRRLRRSNVRMPVAAAVPGPDASCAASGGAAREGAAIDQLPPGVAMPPCGCDGLLVGNGLVAGKIGQPLACPPRWRRGSSATSLIAGRRLRLRRAARRMQPLIGLRRQHGQRDRVPPRSWLQLRTRDTALASFACRSSTVCAASRARRSGSPAARISRSSRVRPRVSSDGGSAASAASVAAMSLSPCVSSPAMRQASRAASCVPRQAGAPARRCHAAVPPRPPARPAAASQAAAGVRRYHPDCEPARPRVSAHRAMPAAPPPPDRSADPRRRPARSVPRRIGSCASCSATGSRLRRACVRGVAPRAAVRPAPCSAGRRYRPAVPARPDARRASRCRIMVRQHADHTADAFQPRNALRRRGRELVASLLLCFEMRELDILLLAHFRLQVLRRSVAAGHSSCGRAVGRTDVPGRAAAAPARRALQQ